MTWGVINLATPSSSDWATDCRLNSSFGTSDANGWITTNAISCKEGDILRVKALDMRNGDSNGAYYGRIVLWDESGEAFAYFNAGAKYSEYNNKTYIREQITDENGIQTYTLALNGAGQNVQECYSRTLSAIRLCGVLKGAAEDVVITLNQEIE